MPAPVDIYQESDMIIRTIRDIFTADVNTIYIDEHLVFECWDAENREVKFP